MTQDDPVSGRRMSAWHRLALLMQVLGEDAFSDFTQQLDDREFKIAQRAIDGLDTESSELNETLLEYGQTIEAADSEGAGGAALALYLMEDALGKERAAEVFEKASLGAPEVVFDSSSISRRIRALSVDLEEQGPAGEISGFHELAELEIAQAVELLEPQRAEMVAIVLSQLTPDRAAQILSEFDGATQVEVTRELALLDGVPTNTIEQVDTIVYNLIDGQAEITPLDGPEAAAKVLQRIREPEAVSILGDLSREHPPAANDIRQRLLLFEDISRMTVRSFRRLVSDIEESVLVNAMRGASPVVLARIYQSVSKNHATRLKEELEYGEEVTDAATVAARGEIVEKVRSLVSSGVQVFEESGHGSQ